MIVPVRLLPVFEATVYCTLPLPLPDALPVIEIHDAFGVAVHAHPAGMVTVTVPLLLPDATLALVGASAAAHDPACVMVKACPPIVIVPVRPAPVLASTEYCTLPLLVPDAPSVTEIHEAFDVAVHEHPDAIVTATVPLLPITGAFVLVGASEARHDPACVTVNVWPAIVAVPVRDPPVFAATLRVMLPLPDPELVPLTVSQLTLPAAVHEQFAAA